MKRVYFSKIFKILLLTLTLLILILYLLISPNKITPYINVYTGEEVPFKEKLDAIYFYNDYIKIWKRDGNNLKIYYKNNKLALKGQFDNSGQKIGEWLMYNINGEQISKIVFKKDIIVYSEELWQEGKAVGKLIGDKKYSVDFIQNGKTETIIRDLSEKSSFYKVLEKDIKKEQIVYYQPPSLYRWLNTKKIFNEKGLIKKEILVYIKDYQWRKSYSYHKNKDLEFIIEHEDIPRLRIKQGVLNFYKNRKKIRFEFYSNSSSDYIMVLYEDNDNFDKKKVSKIIKRFISNRKEVVFSKI